MPTRQKDAQTLLGNMERRRSNPSFVGLVRANPADPTSVLYSSTPDGSKWVPIPASHIQTIDFLEDVETGGSTYPLARMQMRPVRRTAASVYKDLAEHHAHIPLPTTMAAMKPAVAGLAAGSPGGDQQKCGYVWTGSGYSFVCI